MKKSTPSDSITIPRKILTNVCITHSFMLLHAWLPCIDQPSLARMRLARIVAYEKDLPWVHTKRWQTHTHRFTTLIFTDSCESAD